jgi:alkylation response protein AidB-like acyl-CoA dehydrogenase
MIAPRVSTPSLLYRIPNISMFSWTVATVPLGIAEGVMRQFIASAASKVRAGHTATLAQREIVHDSIGRLEAKRRAARAFMLEAMSDLMAATDTSGDKLVQARATYRTAMSYAAETGVEIVDKIVALHGAGALFESSPFERAQRDVHAATKHIAMSPTLFVNAGRILLGLSPLTPRF